MKSSQERTRDKIVAFLNKQGVLKKCSSCGNYPNDSSHYNGELTAWFLGDYKDSYDCGEQVIPLVIIECNRCASIQLFSERSLEEAIENA